MNNRVLTNFRDHPSLRYDDPQSVFKLDGKVYLISEGVVRQIIPKSLQRDNIGEPYRNLLQLNYLFADDQRIFDPHDVIYGHYESRIIFAPEDEKALRQLFN